MSGFEWPALLDAGLHGLQLRPKEFWELTPAELLVMLGKGKGPQPLSRSRLSEMLAAFPDALE